MLFALGLAKKIVVADGVAPYADSVFDAAAGGAVPTGAEAWMGALAYTFQLYFDFSGYSDMAVGLSMIFGVKQVIAYVSQCITLNPGDVIFTGTPPGVGLGKKPTPVFLKAGQVMKLGIAGLGEQQQKLVASS